ncbi:MAG: hypothetical protein E6J06_00855 [Chloroflexi bacterium]|nr:MAG: hypothetical protein E6J06_00855 [Chloroflexota bacterium]
MAAHRKSPWAAAALAVIPGCGHFYVIGLSLGVPLELGPGALYVFSIVDAYRTAKHMESTGS